MLMKNKKTKEEGTSIKMLLVYFALVLSLIITAFIFRAISLINSSTFDGENRYTVAFAEKGTMKGIISFEPSTSSLSILKINPDLPVSINKMNLILGLIPDAVIESQSLPDLSDPVPSIMQSLLWQWNTDKKNLTTYDIFQLWIYSTKIPASTINVREIDKKINGADIDNNIALLFPDEKLAGENLSLQIINASGTTGLGARLERALTNIGGNIVSIQTAPKTEKISKISYYKNADSYTLSKMTKLLPFKLIQMNKQSISDIIITIGEDNKKTNLF